MPATTLPIHLAPRFVRGSFGTRARWLIVALLAFVLLGCSDTTPAPASDSDAVDGDDVPWLLVEPITVRTGDTIEVEGEGWDAEGGPILISLAPAGDELLGAVLAAARYWPTGQANGPAFSLEIELPETVELQDGSTLPLAGAGLMVVATQGNITIGQRIDVSPN